MARKRRIEGRRPTQRRERWHHASGMLRSLWRSLPVAPMMATLASVLPVGNGWTYKVKWDGYRAQLVKDGPRVRLVSRNLKNLTAAYPHIPPPRLV